MKDAPFGEDDIRRISQFVLIMMAVFGTICFVLGYLTAA